MLGPGAAASRRRASACARVMMYAAIVSKSSAPPAERARRTRQRSQGEARRIARRGDCPVCSRGPAWPAVRVVSRSTGEPSRRGRPSRRSSRASSVPTSRSATSVAAAAAFASARPSVRRCREVAERAAVRLEVAQRCEVGRHCRPPARAVGGGRHGPGRGMRYGVPQVMRHGLRAAYAERRVLPVHAGIPRGIESR